MASILIVEDTPDMRNILIRQLRFAGHQVISAVNGLEGIVYAREQLPDLIVMDLVMPILNGLEATKQLRADARCADLPILAMTALPLDETTEQARAAGCDGFLSKPFTML